MVAQKKENPKKSSQSDSKIKEMEERLSTLEDIVVGIGDTLDDIDDILVEDEKNIKKVMGRMGL
jgi:uncharacterized coiled-coil protein SlyX